MTIILIQKNNGHLGLERPKSPAFKFIIIDQFDLDKCGII